MTLTEALDLLFKGLPYDMRDWRNPIRPYSVSGVVQTPYEAYKSLYPQYQSLICRWIGHTPKRGEE
jgi:energy-converting hydrogenase Eha subunit F